MSNVQLNVFLRMNKANLKIALPILKIALLNLKIALGNLRMKKHLYIFKIGRSFFPITMEGLIKNCCY